jgi:uncharacterized integral membrane protein
MKVLVFILVLIIAAYLAMFSLANTQTYSLNLWLYGGQLESVRMWQVIAVAAVAGFVIGVLARSSTGGGLRERLRASEQQLRQTLAAAEDGRKRLAGLEAENERLKKQAAAAESKPAAGDTDRVG